MFSHDQQVLRRHGDLGVVGLLESPFRIITSTEPNPANPQYFSFREVELRQLLTEKRL
jgi:hypothetical protein